MPAVARDDLHPGGRAQTPSGLHDERTDGRPDSRFDCFDFDGSLDAQHHPFEIALPRKDRPSRLEIAPGWRLHPPGLRRRTSRTTRARTRAIHASRRAPSRHKPHRGSKSVHMRAASMSRRNARHAASRSGSSGPGRGPSSSSLTVNGPRPFGRGNAFTAEGSNLPARRQRRSVEGSTPSCRAAAASEGASARVSCAVLRPTFLSWCGLPTRLSPTAA
jgi:hypothetical protein